MLRPYPVQIADADPATVADRAELTCRFGSLPLRVFGRVPALLLIEFRQFLSCQTVGEEVGLFFLLGDLDPVASPFQRHLCFDEFRVRQPGGVFVTETPQLSSDGWNGFKFAVEGAFGWDVNYGQVIKSYAGANRRAGTVLRR